MKKYILMSVLLLIVFASFGQKVADPGRKSITDSCDKFMKLFSEGRHLKAIEMLKTISVLDGSDIDTLAAQVDDQLEPIGATYGKMISYEFIKDKEIKDFLVNRIYLLRFEKYILKLSFVINKSSFGWKVINFDFNEKIEDIF